MTEAQTLTPQEKHCVNEALSILARYAVKGPLMTSPAIIKDFLRLKYGGLDHECFGVLFLNAQHRLIEHRVLFRGTLTETRVYPREIAKEALALGAACVVLIHNHPSGETQPSRADELLTQTIKSSLSLLDIATLDHFIVAHSEVLSFAERGLM